jgi:hypothetical protein
MRTRPRSWSSPHVRLSLDWVGVWGSCDVRFVFLLSLVSFCCLFFLLFLFFFLLCVANLPDARKRHFEPARPNPDLHSSSSPSASSSVVPPSPPKRPAFADSTPTTSSISTGDSAATDALLFASTLRKKPAFQPSTTASLVSPTLSAHTLGSSPHPPSTSAAGPISIADMDLPPPKSSFHPATGISTSPGPMAGGAGVAAPAPSFTAALHFQPKKAAFQPALAVDLGPGGGVESVVSPAFAAGPKTPPRRVFQPAVVMGGDGAGSVSSSATDPFAHLKSMPPTLKPAFQPASTLAFN